MREELSKAMGSLCQRRFVFLGTGASEGIPRISCLTAGSDCTVCRDALKPGSRNRRRCTGALVQVDDKVVLIDCGKMFWESAIQHMVALGIDHVDAVVITHEHADALYGLDDLRDFSRKKDVKVYLREADMECVRQAFPYLAARTNSKKNVAKLDFHIIDGSAPFAVEGMNIVPLPVYHGKGFISLGFLIGNIAYISDVSEIPEKTFGLLAGAETVVMDALREAPHHNSHFTLGQAVDALRRIGPRLGLLTGLGHDLDHEGTEAWLESNVPELPIKAAYDGMALPLVL